MYELSYESHLSYASPNAQQASSRDYNANWHIALDRTETLCTRSPTAGALQWAKRKLPCRTKACHSEVHL
jgi:hypothetical protein